MLNFLFMFSFSNPVHCSPSHPTDSYIPQLSFCSFIIKHYFQKLFWLNCKCMIKWLQLPCVCVHACVAVYIHIDNVFKSQEYIQKGIIWNSMVYIKLVSWGKNSARYSIIVILEGSKFHSLGNHLIVDLFLFS